jgi:hypothetical protein
MYVSDKYHKHVRKIRSNSKDKPEERLLGEIREVYLANLNNLPVNMRHDLFNSFVQMYYESENQRQDIFVFAEHLGGVIDLFNREYDDANTTMSDREWIVVRDLTDEFADDLDLETLTYVMNELLSGGHIRG